MILIASQHLKTFVIGGGVNKYDFLLLCSELCHHLEDVHNSKKSTFFKEPMHNATKSRIKSPSKCKIDQ